jgi:superfamily I DNA and/or RNA helicase
LIAFSADAASPESCEVLSLVRSNESHEVGFLADVRRMNVAITRARRSVTLIGDGETVSSDPFLSRMVQYLPGMRLINN